jgi:4-amino-4-deoxy-L-arabinose transferase-like glycosyltransferase
VAHQILQRPPAADRASGYDAPSGFGPRLVRLLRAALLAGAGLYVLAYLAIAIARLGYPYELEWIEGGTLEHVRRVLAGAPLYVPPSLEFVPLLYPPLYYYASAALVALVGDGFLALRLVSFGASLACFALIYAIVHHETRNRTTGFLAAALFAALFREAGAWLDLGRVDSLFLALLLGAVLVVRRGESVAAAALAALLIALSYMTKQSALLVAAALVGYALLAKPRFGVWYGAFTIALLGGGILLLDRATDGWFLYYTWTMPRHHDLVQSRFVGFWTEDLLRPLPVAVAASAALLVALARARDYRRGLFYLALLGGTAATSWASRLHSGGYDNVMLVVYSACAIVAAGALHRALESRRVSDPRRRVPLHAALYAAAALQFLILVYHPIRQLPTAADRAAGDALVTAIAELPGDVYLPGHGYLATMAGKPAYAHAAMITDVIRAIEGPAKDMMAEAFGEALRSRRFDAIIMDSEFPPSCPPRGETVTNINWFCQDIHDHYRRVGSLLEDRTVFWPRTGVRRRPEQLFVRNPTTNP